MKKLLRRFTFISLVLTTAVATYFVTGHKSPDFTEEEHEENGPGWFEQFRQMRLGDQTTFPSGLYSLWSKTSLSKASVDVIDSVQELGPNNVGGRTRAILIDKLNANRIFAGGISGGLWVSENRGSSWTAINDQELNLNITCITQDPFQPGNIYYGTGEGAGNSSAAPGAGIFKSTDGGASFNRLISTAGADFEYCWSIRSSLVKADEVYVSTNARGVFRTQDGGQSWQKIFATTSPVHDVEVFPDGSVMLAIKSLGIYRSFTGDSGSFFKLGGGLPTSGMGRTELAYCATSPNVVYAAISNSADNGLLGLYRSSDTGNTWLTRTSPATGNVVTFPYTWYCLAMGVNAYDSNRVFIGSVTCGYTTNGGLSWQKAYDSHSDYHAVVTVPSDSNNMLVGNDGGIYQYGWPNPLVQVVTLNNGYNVTQYYQGCYAPTGLTVLGGTQDNGTHYSLNAAPTFKKVMGSDGAFAQINQQNPNIAYSSTQNGNISKTNNINSSVPGYFNVKRELDNDSDGDIDEGAWFINPYYMSPLNGDILFYPTKRRLWRTTNGADNWEQVTKTINVGTTQECYAFGLSADQDPTAYVGGSGGLLYRINRVLTDTPGMEKSIRNSEPLEVKTGFISCIRVHPRNRNVIFVTLSNYSDKPRIWRVSPANADTPVWTPVSGNLPVMLPVGSMDLHPDNPDSVWIAGTDFGVYVTRDAGNTWEKDTRVPNVVVDLVTIRPSDRKAFLFTHGRGVWVAHLKQLPKVATSTGPGIISPGAFRIYPNPASEWLTVEHPAFKDKEVQVSVYDLGGKIVMEVSALPGEKIDIGQLPKGFYLLTARSGTDIFSGKIIKY